MSKGHPQDHPRPRVIARHNENPPTPATLEMAQSVMGNRTKSLIVRHLWQHGSSRGTDIIAETGLSGATLSQAMTQLESWGVVEGSLPSAERHGRPVTFTLDRSRLRELINLWTAFIEGDDL